MPEKSQSNCSILGCLHFLMAYSSNVAPEENITCLLIDVLNSGRRDLSQDCKYQVIKRERVPSFLKRHGIFWQFACALVGRSFHLCCQVVRLGCHDNAAGSWLVARFRW